MSMVIVLDTGPVGMITNPNASATNRECYQWMESLVLQGSQVWVPEIADYEVRRELLGPIRHAALPGWICSRAVLGICR